MVPKRKMFLFSFWSLFILHFLFHNYRENISRNLFSIYIFFFPSLLCAPFDIQFFSARRDVIINFLSFAQFMQLTILFCLVFGCVVGRVDQHKSDKQMTIHWLLFMWLIRFDWLSTIGKCDASDRLLRQVSMYSRGLVDERDKIKKHCKIAVKYSMKWKVLRQWTAIHSRHDSSMNVLHNSLAR